jgi:hypothetical protein
MSAALAAVLLLWLAGNLTVVVVGLARSRVLAGEVSGMLDRIVPSAIRAQDELAGSAGRRPERRWIEQHCSFASDGSGWIAYGYRETCVMRSVSAWQVDSEQEARALLPVPGGDVASPAGCLRLGPVGEVGVVDRPEATYVDLDVVDAAMWCTTASHDAPGARELVGDRTPVNSGRWLVVEEQQPLVDEPIGCTRWSVVLCGNPWLVHAYGDWPSGPVTGSGQPRR